jgi:hypothetical protein
MEVLYEDIRDGTAIHETASSDLNHPYEYVKPAAGAESAENYQFTLCSAYGVPVETGKIN